MCLKLISNLTIALDVDPALAKRRLVHSCLRSTANRTDSHPCLIFAFGQDRNYRYPLNYDELLHCLPSHFVGWRSEGKGCFLSVSFWAVRSPLWADVALSAEGAYILVDLEVER